MKFLIYGSKGWIGSMVCEYLMENKKDIEIFYGKYRVDNENLVEQEIKTICPTHVLCFIGRTYGEFNGKFFNTIDYLEQEGKLVENIKDNLYAPIILAKLCEKYNIHMTYLGTGCIFEYDSTHDYNSQLNGFTEYDNPNFFGSSYSIVKGFTDRLMRQFDKNVLNLRIRMPIASKKNSRNFITKITQYKKICSIPNSMSVLDELIPIMVDMAEKKIVGTFNMVNPGLISHNEILEIYKELVDPNFVWENYSIEEQNKLLDAKRSNNYLDTNKLKDLYPNINSIEVAVRKILEKYDK